MRAVSFGSARIVRFVLAAKAIAAGRRLQMFDSSALPRPHLKVDPRGAGGAAPVARTGPGRGNNARHPAPLRWRGRPDGRGRAARPGGARPAAEIAPGLPW